MNDTYESESFVDVKRAYDNALICKKAGIISVILGVIIVITIGVLRLNNLLPEPREGLANVLVPILWLGGAFAVWYSGKLKNEAKMLYAETILKPVLLEKYPQATYTAFEMDTKNEGVLGKLLAENGMPIAADGVSKRKTNIFKANDESGLEYGSIYYYERVEHGVGRFDNNISHTGTYLIFNIDSNIRQKDVFEISSGKASKVEGYEIDDKSFTIDCFSDRAKEILKSIHDDFGNCVIYARKGQVKLSFNDCDVITSCPDSLKDISLQELNSRAREQVEKLEKLVADLSTVITETDFAKYKQDFYK